MKPAPPVLRRPLWEGAPPERRASQARLHRPLAGIAVALCAVTLCTVALLLGQLNPYLGDYGDDAEFLILGQGLATGLGYAWVNSPELPAHNRYPPGYPALLAATMAVTGTAAHAAAAIVPAKVATAATLLGAGSLLWPLARRRLPAAWAAGAVALFMLNPFAIRFAGQVMSDVPYVLALLAALAWADHLNTTPTRALCSRRRAPGGEAGEEAGGVNWGAGSRARSDPWGPWGWVTLGALLALGAYVRSIGIAGAAGVLAWSWWWSWRHGRSCALAATGTFLLLLFPWWLRDASIAGSWRYLEELLAAQYLVPTAGTATSEDFLARAAGNVAFLVGKPRVFGLAGVLVGLAVGGIVLLGYARVAWRRGGAAEWATVALMVAVLFWPIKTGRYLLPVIPLLGIYAVAGSLLLASWLPQRLTRRDHLQKALRRWTLRAGGVGVVLVALLEGAYAAREGAANAAALSAGGGPAGYYRERPEWAHYFEAADWLREHAGPQDVALARRHFILYVYSGHYADKYRFETSEAELAYLMSGSARKLVVEDAFQELRGDFAPLLEVLRSRGADLRLRYQTAPPVVRVWELVRPAPASG